MLIYDYLTIFDLLDHMVAQKVSCLPIGEFHLIVVNVFCALEGHWAMAETQPCDGEFMLTAVWRQPQAPTSTSAWSLRIYYKTSERDNSQRPHPHHIRVPRYLSGLTKGEIVVIVVTDPVYSQLPPSSMQTYSVTRMLWTHSSTLHVLWLSVNIKSLEQNTPQ